jgi:hypothetical protein
VFAGIFLPKREKKLLLNVRHERPPPVSANDQAPPHKSASNTMLQTTNKFQTPNTNFITFKNFDFGFEVYLYVRFVPDISAFGFSSGPAI